MKAGPTAPSLGWSDVERLVLNPVAFVVLGYGLARYIVPHPGRIAAGVIALVAVAAAVASWRRPMAALTALVALFPFQLLVQGWLFEHGVPQNQVVIAGYWKELVVVVVFARAWQERRARQPGPLELFAAGLLAAFVIYLLLPFGPDLHVRYVAMRADVGFVVLFFVARWLPSTTRQRDVFERVFLGSACVLAGLGLWNYFGQTGWSNWIDSMGLRDYQATLIHGTPPPAVLHVKFGDTEVVRAGSILLSPNELAYLMIVSFGLAVSRMLRRVGRAFERLAAVLFVCALIPTFSRSAIALLVVVGLVVAAGAGRLSRGVGVVAIVGVLLVALLLSFGDATGQIASGFDTSDTRTSQHIERLGDSVSRIASHPFGSGLGTAAALSIRFDVAGRADTPENFYFQLGTEVGVIGMVLFLCFVVALWRSLWQRVRVRRDLDAVAATAGLGAVALGAVVLDTFQLTSVTWPLFVLAGLAMRHADEEANAADAPALVR